MLPRLRKKGQMGLVISLIGALVVVAVLLLVLFKINASIGDGYTSTDTTGIYNATQDVKDAGDEVGSNLSLIAIITVFAVIIGLVVTYFISRMRV